MTVEYNVTSEELVCQSKCRAVHTVHCTLQSVYLSQLVESEAMSAFYQHKSGAQKRHEKEQRDKEAQKGSRTLFHVGVIKASSSLSSDWRPTIPQVMETICEKSQGGNVIDGIKEQGEGEGHRHRAMNSHRTLREV